MNLADGRATEQYGIRAGLHAWGWPAVALLAAILVLVLAMQKRDLEERVVELIARTREPHIGFVVPVFTAPAVAGGSVTLGRRETPGLQLLFVFNQGCAPCEASIPAWNVLSSNFEKHPMVDVLGVSLDSMEVAEKLARTHYAGFSIVTMTDPRMQVVWRARSVPQILVIDGLGRVHYFRTGELIAPGAIDSVRAAVLSPIAARDTPFPTNVNPGRD